MKTVRITTEQTAKLIDLLTFSLKKAYSFENNKYLVNIAHKVRKQNKISVLVDEIRYHDITLNNKDWDTCLFFLDLPRTLKTRKLKKQFFKYIGRVSNHIFVVTKSNTTHGKQVTLNNIDNLRTISNIIKTNLCYSNKLINVCNQQILSLSLERYN